MIENEKLITTQNFDDIPCDFYKNIDRLLSESEASPT